MHRSSTISILARLLWCAVFLWAGWILYQSTRLPSPQKVNPSPDRRLEPETVKAEPSEIDWQAFHDPSAQAPVVQADSDQGRFRLAGTFVSYSGENSSVEVRKAIIDDEAKQGQVLVQQGDKIDHFTVDEIRRDTVRLIGNNGKEILLALSFSSPLDIPKKQGPTILQPKTFEDMPALETSPYGKRIADNRWVLKRDALMNYYEELLEKPQRMASLFASMEDVIEEDGGLNGYQVQIKGEKQLFDAMGLQEGDIIREVNSIKMTNARRSEYLVREFIQGRLNAVVFDVEREGERQKLIQLIR